LNCKGFKALALGATLLQVKPFGKVKSSQLWST